MTHIATLTLLVLKHQSTDFFRVVSLTFYLQSILRILFVYAGIYKVKSKHISCNGTAS